MTARLLLFDLDGTLVDSAAMILAAQAEAFAACGLEPPGREKSLSIVGLSLNEAFRALVGATGPIEALAGAYRIAFHRLRLAGTIPETLFGGAQAALDRLGAEEGHALGVATGKSRRGVAALVEKHGWHDLFATVQTADDAPSKPHPAMILQACAATGHAPGQTWMIGDSSFDMAMARAAGARAIGVAWGFQPRAALVEAGAERIVEDFDALVDLVLHG